MNFRRWQFHTEIPSAPGKWEVYYPTTDGERRKRFSTEEQAERFAAQMGGTVHEVQKQPFALRKCR